MQTFEVRAWDDAGVRVVEVSGEFDIAACERFREACDRDDAELVVVDLRRVSFLDASGLRELIDLHRMTELRGTRLAILRPARAGRQHLQAHRAWTATCRSTTRRCRCSPSSTSAEDG